MNTAATSHRCRHCKDDISGRQRCKSCERDLTDQCMTCHREVVHGKVVNQNIHICGNPHGRLNSLDADTDAYS